MHERHIEALLRVALSTIARLARVQVGRVGGMSTVRPLHKTVERCSARERRLKKSVE